MLKVVLIDDEPTIREGLKSIIDWEAYGFAVCGEASNGNEGLEKICTLGADLAIVDVKMPVMDGLQMVSELNTRRIECEYIILSAYSDFKYAQSAIELGIGSYVLKPIEESELIEKLLKVRESIQNRKKAKDYLDLSVNLSRIKLLQQMVQGQPMPLDIEMDWDLYGLTFPWKQYQIGLIEVGKKLEGVTRSRVEREAEAFARDHELGYVFDIDRYTGILLNVSQNPANTRLMSSLHDRIKRYCKTDVAIALGPAVESLSELKTSYLYACRLLEKKFIYGYKKIITVPNKLPDLDRPPEQQDWNVDSVIDDIFCAVDVGNIENINNILEDMRSLFTQGEYEEGIIKVHFTNIYTAVVSRIMGSDEALKTKLGIRQEVLSEICGKTSLLELHGYIKFVFASLAEELSKLRPVDPIKKILDYIDRNYARDLKLEGLAVLFHYNSAYLGKLIRSKTGVQFSTYLDNVRMEKAKELLKDGYKVYEVARKVGYKYIDYFYRKFRKHTGVSPTDYKEKSDGEKQNGPTIKMDA